MKKGIICALLTAFILSSCVTTKFETRLNHLELGMTKQEVVSLLGKDYVNMGAVSTPDGNLETWRYIDQNLLVDQSSIKATFLNGRLVEWFREKPQPKKSVDPHPKKE